VDFSFLNGAVAKRSKAKVCNPPRAGESDQRYEFFLVLYKAL
jgi:hypothetical protein